MKQRQRAERRAAKARRPYDAMKRQKMRDVRAKAQAGDYFAQAVLRDLMELCDGGQQV